MPAVGKDATGIGRGSLPVEGRSGAALDSDRAIVQEGIANDRVKAERTGVVLADFEEFGGDVHLGPVRSRICTPASMMSRSWAVALTSSEPLRSLNHTALGQVRFTPRQSTKNFFAIC